MEELSQERKKRKKLTDQIYSVEVGCPLSGTLFIFGIEILALAIKKNPKIEGIRVGAREVKITQYAEAPRKYVFLGRDTVFCGSAVHKTTKCRQFTVFAPSLDDSEKGTKLRAHTVNLAFKLCPFVQ